MIRIVLWTADLETAITRAIRGLLESGQDSWQGDEWKSEVVSRTHHSDSLVARLRTCSGSGAALIAKIEPVPAANGPRLSVGRRCDHVPRVWAVLRRSEFVAIVMEDLGGVVPVDLAVLTGRLSGASLRPVIETLFGHLTDHVHGDQHDDEPRWASFQADFLDRTAGRVGLLPEPWRAMAKTMLRAVADARSEIEPYLPTLVDRVHGDPHLGNVLLNATGQIFVVDDTAVASRSPLYDYGKVMQSWSAGYSLAMLPGLAGTAARAASARFVVSRAFCRHLGLPFDAPELAVAELAAGIHVVAAAPHHLHDRGETERMLSRGSARVYQTLDQLKSRKGRP